MRIILLAIGTTLLALLTGLSLYRSGAIQLNRPTPERYRVIGIDVSHHQGPIDWATLSSAGIHFAFIKATEGRDFVDPQFRYNWREANAVGIPRGAYHFFSFCSSGRAQAEHFLSVVPPDTRALPPVADVEFTGNCQSWSDLQAVASELEIFLALLEAAWSLKPILYVTSDSFHRVLGGQSSGHPIWIRHVFSEPQPGAFSDWSLWQFSDNSRLPGISGPVDRNALRPGLSLTDLAIPPTRNTSPPSPPGATRKEISP